jgi:hypothetical protein
MWQEVGVAQKKIYEGANHRAVGTEIKGKFAGNILKKAGNYHIRHG